MKSFFINMFLDKTFDFIIEAFQRLAQKSSTKIDNKMVEALRDLKPDVIADVKAHL